MLHMIGTDAGAVMRVDVVLDGFLDVFLVASYLYALPYLLSMLLTSLAAIIYLTTTRRAESAAPGGKPAERRFLVVIPARDEEATIAKSVRSCRAIEYPASLFDILVIADNCSDHTASQAQDAGARVLERFDHTKKSKGHAIEHLIEALRDSGEFDALDALVIIDADSTVDPDILEQFSSGLNHGSDWMQCYDCVANADRTWRTRIMAYGFSLFNGVTLAGRHALGLSASLRGNGMCISTDGLRRVPWKAHSLVEDLEYSWIVRLAGERISFVKDTTVFATMLREGGTPLANQRRRWEFGRIAIAREMLGPLLRCPHLGWLQKAAAVVELTSQPTSYIVLWYLIMSLLAAVAIPRMVTDNQYHLIIFICVSHSIATLALAVHALSPFLTSLLPWRFALSLGYFPYYLFWKLIVLAQGTPEHWVATLRESKRGRRNGGERRTLQPLDSDA